METSFNNFTFSDLRHEKIWLMQQLHIADN